jgi:WD40 repeat protein
MSQEVPRSSGCVRFRSDGTECLFTAADGILAWNRDQRTVRKLCSTSEPPETISLNCRLTVIRKYEDKRTLVRVLSIEDQRELGSIEVYGIVNRAEFVDDDRRLGLVVNPLEASGTEAFVWDYLTTQRTPAIKSSRGRGAFSADGRRYAAEAENNAVRVWDTERGSVLVTTGSHSGETWEIAFSPDGRFLASAGEGQRPRGHAFGEIRILDAATGSEVATIIDNTSWGVTALAFSPGGTELAAGNGDGIVRFWKVPAAD